VDDTKIFLGLPSSKLHDIISTVNEDLKEILSWCCRNSLLINPDKTKLLYVGVPQLMGTLPATLPSATILGTEIKCRLVAGQRAFAFSGANFFNSLPKFIRDKESLSGFKRRIFKNILKS